MVGFDAKRVDSVTSLDCDLETTQLNRQQNKGVFCLYSDVYSQKIEGEKYWSIRGKENIKNHLLRGSEVYLFDE